MRSRTNSPPRPKPSSPTRCTPNEATDFRMASSSNVFWARERRPWPCWSSKDEKEFVLKVALNEDDNARLHEEAEALRTIHSEFIVAIEDELDNGRQDRAGPAKGGRQDAVRPCCARKVCRAWTCSPVTATTCCRRLLRWNVMASFIGTSSPTTSAFARSRSSETN